MALKPGPADVSSVRLTVIVVPTATLVALLAGFVSLTAGGRDVRRPEAESVRVHRNADAFLIESAGIVTVYKVSLARFAAGSIVSTLRVYADRTLDRRCPSLERDTAEGGTLHSVAAQGNSDRLVHRDLGRVVRGTGCRYRKGRAEAEDVLAVRVAVLVPDGVGRDGRSVDLARGKVSHRVDHDGPGVGPVSFVIGDSL